ncbi:MAG: N-sulfoglucosamine sulfohydrolase [Halieaceae bacterium]
MKFFYFVFAVLFVGEVSASAANRPNILLLMAEDMSSRVGAFGDKVAVTPNLDALAGQGVRYTNTFTAAGVCAPSRAAHILGMHQISTGAQHMRASGRRQGGYYAVPPVEVKAYPELLRAAGYYTYTDHKLDYQFSSVRSGSGPFTIWDAQGDASWQDRKEGQPFFGFVNFEVTHESGIFRPLGSAPHSKTHAMLQRLRARAFEGVKAKVVSPDAVVLPPYYPDTPTVRADIARHYDNIAHMDKQIGTILKQLEADGLAESTIVIWTTDHGDGLPRAKRELFDSGLKVPMIIRWPEAYRPDGFAPGGLDQRLISFIDLAPTVLKLAGVARPDYLQGQDFSTPGEPSRHYIYASRDRIDEVPDRQRAVRDGRYKYIRSWYPTQPEGIELAFRENIDMVREMRQLYKAGKLNAVQRQWFEAPGEERLFDLERDPFELNNVKDDPKYQQDLIRLREALDTRLADIGDWGEDPESAMVERFAPGGVQPVTSMPVVVVANDTMTLKAVDQGSSTGYRVDTGPWELYSRPVDVSGAERVEAKAVRYGWKESEVVVYDPEPEITGR